MYSDRNARYLGPERQLFVDDYIIDELVGVKRRIGGADKHMENPVLPMEKAWEKPYQHNYFTVTYDSERGYRAWYQTWPDWKHTPQDDTYSLHCYATSSDGLHWNRPSLGLIDWKDSKDNNIFLTHVEAACHYEKPDEPDPSKRYRMLCLSHDRSRWIVFFSPDGINWPQNESDAQLLFEKIGILARDQAQLIYDERTSQWVMICKLCRQINDYPYGFTRRCLGITTSEDFEHWEYPELILSPDAIDDARTAERCVRYADRVTTNHPDEYVCDLQQMTIWPYEGVYIGLISVFDASGFSPQGNQDGTGHVQLAVSRDLRHWERVADRDILIDIGPKDSWEEGMILGISSQPVYLEDEIRIYYSGRSPSHLNRSMWETHRLPELSGGIGLVTLRRDGWVALEVGMSGGYMLTKPFKFTGKGLFLNVDPARRAYGQVFVEVLTPEGELIEGFSVKDCDPAEHDNLSHKVTWKGSWDLSSLEGRIIRLKFHCCASRLYSFWFES